MNDLINIHDVIHLGGSAIVLVVLWLRLGDVKERIEKHEKTDEDRFQDMTGRIDSLVDGWHR